MKLKDITEKIKHPFFVLPVIGITLLLIGYLVGSTQRLTVLPLTEAPASESQTEASVQTQEETAVAAEAASSALGKLDLNTATREQLIDIPGIGEKTADLILEYREAHGGFQSVEELTEIRGIGEKKLQKLQPYLTIGTES